MSTLRTDFLQTTDSSVTVPVASLANLPPANYFKDSQAIIVASVTALRALDKTVNARAATMGYYAVNDGGQGNYYLDEADLTSLDNGGTIIVATDGGRWKLLVENKVINVLQFGAKADDATDNAGSFTSAATALSAQGNGKLYFPRGVYRTSTSITVGGSGVLVAGECRNGTILKNTTTNLPTLVVTTGSNNITLQDFTLDRTANGTFGGDGIAFAKGGVADGFIYRIYAKNNYHGVAVGGTGYSIMEDIFCERNFGNGLDITNSNAFTTCQWYIRNVLCQLNALDGVRIQSVATTPVGGHMALGELNGVRTFANSGRGLIVLGTPQVGVYSLRAKGCFFGEDGGDEVYLDTYGNLHTFNDCFIELGGTSTTGPLYATPPTFNSWGVMVTANTPDVSINGGIINGCANAGIYYASPTVGGLRVNGTILSNNGNGGAVGPSFNSGVVVIAGTITCVGVRSYGQENGSYNAATGGDSFVGCDFRGNSLAVFGGNVAGNVTAGNRP